MRKKTIQSIAGVISLILLLFYSFFLNLFIEFALKIKKGPETELQAYNLFLVEIIFISIIAIGILISITLIFNLHKKLYSLLSKIFDFEKIGAVFLKDALTSKTNFARKVFIVSSVLAVIWHFKVLLFGDTVAGLANETLTEHLMSTLFLVSFVILIISIFKINTLKVPHRDKGIIKKWLIFCSVSLLFVYLEEISWGQQFLNWESTGVFKEMNTQGETNLHNFITPYFRFIYPLLGIGLFILLSLKWFFNNGLKLYWLKLVTPHQSLIILVFYMAGASFRGHSEIFEELLSLFILFYSIRIFVCLRYPNNLALAYKPLHYK